MISHFSHTSRKIEDVIKHVTSLCHVLRFLIGVLGIGKETLLFNRHVPYQPNRVDIMESAVISTSESCEVGMRSTYQPIHEGAASQALLMIVVACGIS